jgi:hypothetical protein
LYLVDFPLFVASNLLFWCFSPHIYIIIYAFSFFFFLFSYKTSGDVRKASHFQIQLRTPKKLSLDNPEEAAMLKLQDVTGCSVVPARLIPDNSWGGKCLYSKLVRSFIVSGKGRLSQSKDWIQK